MDFSQFRFDPSDAAIAASLSTFILPAIIAIATWYVLRRETVQVRVIASIAAFFFPILAIIGLVLYPRIRPRLASLSSQVRDAAQQASQEVRRAADSGVAASKQLHVPGRDALGREVLVKLQHAGKQHGIESESASPASPAQTRHAAHAPLDPARLMSSDISVRFGTSISGERKLNIPKVVE